MAKFLDDILTEAADKFSDAPFLETDQETVTYSEFDQLVTGTSEWLLNLDVVVGDRVCIQGQPTPSTLRVVFAAARIGCVAVILHSDVVDHALDAVIADSTPVVYIGPQTPSSVRHRFKELPAGLGHAVVGHELPARPARTVSDIVTLTYTSGSTGPPKAVASHHAAMVFAIEAIHERLAYEQSDRVVSPLPLSFDYGLYQAFLCCLSGATLVTLSPRDTGIGLLNALQTREATVFPSTPAVTARLAMLLGRAPRARIPLRLLTNTGAHLPGAWQRQLLERMPQLKIARMYGLTECKRVSIAEPTSSLEGIESSGVPLRGTRIVIRDEDGIPVGDGTPGEICVQGPHLMSGYWRRSAETAETFPTINEVTRELRTGDTGYLDAHGRLYVLGRIDDQYKQNGFRVGAGEVEDAALQHPNVTSACVVPNRQEEGAVLYVTLASPETELTRSDLSKYIESYKVPKSIVFLDELPLNSNGKVDKNTLKRLSAEK